MFASGAGAEVRYVMGVTVVAGMLGVTFFGLFFTPVFYVVLRKIVVRQQERRAARQAAEAAAMRKRHPRPARAAARLPAPSGRATRVPEMPLPGQFDQATGRSDGAAGGLETLGGFRQQRARRADRARARGQHDDRAGGRPPRRKPRALSGLSVYSLFPTVTAVADHEEAQISSQDPFAPPGGLRTETYRAGFDASWEIDLFGGAAQRVPRDQAARRGDAASLADAQLSIVAETAQAWFAMIGARERLALRRQQLANQQDNVGILEARVDAGSSSGLDLAPAEAQMRSIAASVPQAEADLVREEQRLAVLTAWPIQTLRETARRRRRRYRELPVLVATGTPEEWLKRRPDIRAAERELAAIVLRRRRRDRRVLPEGPAARLASAGPPTAAARSATTSPNAGLTARRSPGASSTSAA